LKNNLFVVLGNSQQLKQLSKSLSHLKVTNQIELSENKAFVNLTFHAKVLRAKVLRENFISQKFIFGQV